MTQDQPHPEEVASEEDPRAALEVKDQPEGAIPSQAVGDGAPVDPAAETELWVGRTHWKHYIGRLTIWAGGNLGFAILVIWATPQWEWLTAWRAFWAIVVVLLVTGLLVAGRVFLKIIGHRYRLTSQRLFIERGIFSQTIDQTELIRVDDVRIHKTFLDRVVGLGSVAIVSTDASDREIVIEGIAEPEKTAEVIRSRMRAMRQKSLFIENL